jgi:hypothetical protein
MTNRYDEAELLRAHAPARRIKMPSILGRRPAASTGTGVVRAGSAGAGIARAASAGAGIARAASTGAGIARAASAGAGIAQVGSTGAGVVRVASEGASVARVGPAGAGVERSGAPVHAGFRGPTGFGTSAARVGGHRVGDAARATEVPVHTR